jgi:hypothetical protein
MSRGIELYTYLDKVIPDYLGIDKTRLKKEEIKHTGRDSKRWGPLERLGSESKNIARFRGTQV